jgi:hypothetical protein
MFKLESKDSIIKQIAGIGRAGARLIAAIQVASVQVIAHTLKHGDVSVANQLLDAVPKHQKAALVAFLEMYGPYAYMKQDKNLAYFKANAKCSEFIGKDVTPDYMEKLPRWESMTKPAEPKSVYDAGEAFDKLITSLRKQSVTLGVTVKNAALLDEMTATYNRYMAQLVLGDAATNATGDNVHFEPPKVVATK